MRATRILAFTIGVVLANQWSHAIDPSRVQAQAAASTRVAFEVASVKPNKSGEPRVMIRTEPGGRFTATDASLRVLIRNAYGISEDSRESSMRRGGSVPSVSTSWRERQAMCRRSSLVMRSAR